MHVAVYEWKIHIMKHKIIFFVIKFIS